MASRRMIDQAFWESETVATWDYFQRLLFIGMFCKADDQGRMKANTAWIRAQVFPFDDLDIGKIQEALDLFVGAESILIYEVDGTAYLQFLKWWTWQKPSWAWPSKYPSPPDWMDRVCYRKGNTVIKSNWDGAGAKRESNPNPSEPTVSPPRPHSEPSVTLPPSTSTSGSISTSGSGSGSGGHSTSNNKADDAAAAVAVCLRAVLDLGITEPKASQLVKGRRQNGGLDTLVQELESWIAHFKASENIKNPVGLAIRQVEDRVMPPTPDGSKQTDYLPY